MLNRRRDRYRYVGEYVQSKPCDARKTLFQAQPEPMREAANALICGDPLVFEAVRFIAANVRQNLQVEDVAQHLNTSRRTLIRRFDEVLGRSVASEIRRQRVVNLKRLLKQSGRPIAEIGREYGFSSPAQLSRYFKREVGVTPSAYRRGKIVPEAMTAYR